MSYPWFATTLVALILSAGLARPVIGQTAPKNAEIQAADQELKKLLNQPFELPIFTRKSQLQDLYRRYDRQNDKNGLALTSLELAWVAYQDADYLEADRKLRTIEFSFNSTTTAYWRIKSLRGLLQLEAGKPQEALTDLSQSQANFYSWPEQQVKQVGLAATYRALGQYRKAAGYAYGASRLGASRMVQTEALQVLGDTAFDVGQFEDAIGHYEAAIAYGKSIGLIYGQRSRFTNIHLLTQLGRAYQAVGKTSQAEKVTRESLELAEKATSPQQIIVLLFALNAAAMVNLDAGRNPIALEQLQRAMTIAKSNGLNSAGEITTLINLGRYTEEIGNLTQAIDYYETARKLADRVNDKASEARAQSAIGQIQLKQKKIKAAIGSLTKSIDTFESLQPELRDAQRITLAETQATTYQFLQTALIQENNSDQALIITERARARALVDLLSQRKQTEKTAPKDTAAITLSSIKATAKDQNATIVTYAVSHQLGNPELYTWVIQPDGTIHFKATDLRSTTEAAPVSLIASSRSQNPLKQLIVRSSKTRSEISMESDRPETYAQYASASKSAYQLLIEPIQKWLPKNDRDRVIFVPQGELFLIPFQALQNSQGQYLIQNHTLQIAPSIQTLSLLTSKTRSNSNVMIVGNPSPMPSGYDPLPGSEIEANVIAKLFNTTAILGPNATKANLLKKLSQALLIHFATHGTMDDRSGSESAIILASSDKNDPIAELNSSLTAGEILDLRLKADLVVLSACNTGRGQITGEGVIGLTRSFLSAGVPSLVVSLWQVPDKPTASLMIAFHKNRKKGDGNAQALRQAMLATMKDYPNPQDWAGFMVVGRSD